MAGDWRQEPVKKSVCQPGSERARQPDGWIRRSWVCIGVCRCTTVVRAIHPLLGIQVWLCAWVCCRCARSYTCSPRSEMPPPSFALELLLPFEGSDALQKKCTCIARAPRSPAPRTRGTQSWMSNSVAQGSDRHAGKGSAVHTAQHCADRLPDSPARCCPAPHPSAEGIRGASMAGLHATKATLAVRCRCRCMQG
jgi:hypothetical protein